MDKRLGKDGGRMNRNNLKEYYRKSAGILSLIVILYTLAVSGLAIYIADFEELAEYDTGSNAKYLYALYIAFIAGIFNIIFNAIAGFISLRKESEGVMRFMKFTSVLSIVIGVLNTYSLLSIIKKRDISFDEGSIAIFSITIVSGILIILISVLIFILSKRGYSFVDGKKLAKDIPEDITEEILKYKYKVVLKFAFYLIALPVVFMALYYSREINSYCCTYNTDKSVFINIFFVVFIIGLILSAVGLISVLASFIKKNVLFEKISKIIINITMLLMLVFMVITLFTIKTDFVGANYPDISYMIFTFVLTFISSFICISINYKNKKMD